MVNRNRRRDVRFMVVGSNVPVWRQYRSFLFEFAPILLPHLNCFVYNRLRNKSGFIMSKPPLNDGVRRGRKFDQVLSGASKVFLRDGFEGASVDDIAREAGVSKATLYSYFPDKRLLFAEVTLEQCREQTQRIMAEIHPENPVADVLTAIGRTMLEFVYSDAGIRMFRVVLGETERFPELGEEFYKSGPAYGRKAMTELFEASNARGETKIDDPDFAASQFMEMCKTDHWARVMLGVKRKVSKAEIDAVVAESVEMFMARYGTSKATA